VLLYPVVSNRNRYKMTLVFRWHIILSLTEIVARAHNSQRDERKNVMFNKLLVSSMIVLAIFSTTIPATAAGRGDGGCIIHSKAPLYKHSTGEQLIAIGNIGDCVVGITVRAGFIFGSEYTFEEENGRVHVTFLPDPDEKGMELLGWMNPDDLARFTYECGCGSLKSEREQCTPFTTSSLFPLTHIYNACFKEARDKKRAEMRAQAAATATLPVEQSNTVTQGEKPLLNADIISLVKVGLDDKLIIAKIEAAEATNFDLSTEGLIALKTAKVSNAIIEVMMKPRPAGR
jgi:hypothetical protein